MGREGSTGKERHRGLVMQPEGNGTSGSGRPGRRKSWPGEPRRGCEEGVTRSWHVQGQQGGPGRGGWGRRVQIAQESTAGSENNSRPGGPGPDQIWRFHNSCRCHGDAQTAPPRPLPRSGSQPAALTLSAPGDSLAPRPRGPPQCGAPGGGLLPGTLLSLLVSSPPARDRAGVADDGLGSRSFRGAFCV